MKEDLTRYIRQMLLGPMGRTGQERLRDGYAVIVGCGAIGSTSSSLLARAGVGHLRVIDRDFLEESNLQHQGLYDEEDVSEGLPKAIAAQKKLHRINSTIQIEGIVADVNPTNIEELLNGASVILDGTDNFETRFLINDYAVKTRIPWVYAACLGTCGLVMNVIGGKTPCLRCLIQEPPGPGSLPTCETAGILGPVAKVVASVQAAEAIKILTHNYEALLGGILSIDLWKDTFQEINSTTARSDKCPCCQLGRFDFLNSNSGTLITTLCGTNAVQITPVSPPKAEKIALEEMAKRLAPLGEVSHNPFLLRFKPVLERSEGAEGIEVVVFPDGRAILQGTKEEALARSIYSRYIGL